MTVGFFLAVFGAPLLGALAAVAWWLLRGRGERSLSGTYGAAAVIAGTLGVLADALPRFIGSPLFAFDLPVTWWVSYGEFRFVIAPLAGLLAVIVLAFPMKKRGTSTTAILTPRGPLSFVRPQWLVAPSVFLALLVVTVVACGVVSEPDEQTGRYTAWTVEISPGTAMGTTIYGWFYSLPVLLVLLLLICAAALALFLIARPVLADDAVADEQRRALRSRNVIAAVTATLALALSQAARHVAGAASLRAEFGSFHAWTPIAALGPSLEVASFALAALAVATWCSVALSAVPRRARVRTPSRTGAVS